MALLKNGSRGDEVLELQKRLNQNGYNLTEDGIYGQNTANAVRDYQKKNGLSVDGIYGDQTRASLVGNGQQTTQPENPTQPEPPKYSSYTGVSDLTNQNLQKVEQGFTPSAATTQAMQYLESLRQQAPSQYQSPYGNQMQAIYDKVMGREPFSYDPTGDQLYQIYKDQAVRNGQMAMMNTMGQAAALAGGYGSTYGQAVGQQAYNQYLQGLNDIVPELYDSAFARYQQEGNELMQQYAMLQDRENQAYGRYQDDLSRYYQDLGNAQDQYESLRGFDYDQYLTQMDYWNQRADRENADYWDQLALQQASASGGGGSGSGPSEGKPPTAAMWDEARNVTTDEEADFFSRKYASYNLDDIHDYWDGQGIGKPPLYTTRADAADGKYSYAAEAEILQLIEQKKRDPGSVSLSLAELQAELIALREHRTLLPKNQ